LVIVGLITANFCHENNFKSIVRGEHYWDTMLAGCLRNFQPKDRQNTARGCSRSLYTCTVDRRVDSGTPETAPHWSMVRHYPSCQSSTNLIHWPVGAVRLPALCKGKRTSFRAPAPAHRLFRTTQIKLTEEKAMLSHTFRTLPKLIN